MSGPHPAVAEVRRAVRRSLAGLDYRSTLLVAVSGGADSMALAAATIFETGGTPRRCAAVVIDHQLQEGSREVAAQVARRVERLGLDPVVVREVHVATQGGPEAAARQARYAGIESVADELSADVVLLGHTRDDQAESVLLGLARGSGSRSLSGMAPVRGRYRRPLLALTRETTALACRAEGLEVWEDPHNVEPSFARVRVRQRVLPVLERELGPGVGAALARTSDLLRDDDLALELWADEVRARAASEAGAPHMLEAAPLLEAPAAVRRRALRSVALATGVPGGRLRASHLQDLEALVVSWSGQGEVHLPGGVRVTRSCGRLLFAPEPDAARP